MSLDVIDELLVAELSKAFKVYSIGSWLPLEVEKVRSVCLLPSCKVLRHLWVNLLVPSIWAWITSCSIWCLGGSWRKLVIQWCLNIILGHITSETALHNFTHDATIIAFKDDILQWSETARLVIVRWNFCILFICIFSCLHEPLLLLLKFGMYIWKFLRRELLYELAHQFSLVILKVFSFLLGSARVCVSAFTTDRAYLLQSWLTVAIDSLLSLLFYLGDFGTCIWAKVWLTFLLAALCGLILIFLRCLVIFMICIRWFADISVTISCVYYAILEASCALRDDRAEICGWGSLNVPVCLLLGNSRVHKRYGIQTTIVSLIDSFLSSKLEHLWLWWEDKLLTITWRHHTTIGAIFTTILSRVIKADLSQNVLSHSLDMHICVVLQVARVDLKWIAVDLVEAWDAMKDVLLDWHDLLSDHVVMVELIRWAATRTDHILWARWVTILRSAWVLVDLDRDVVHLLVLLFAAGCRSSIRLRHLPDLRFLLLLAQWEVVIVATTVCVACVGNFSTEICLTGAHRNVTERLGHDAIFMKRML